MKEKIFFPWYDKYKLGIETVDNEHIKLIGFINELYNAVSKAEMDKVVFNAVDKLLDYTDYHFSNEENWFNEYNYKEKKEHLKAHDKFVSKIKAFKEIVCNDRNSALAIIFFLKDWFVNHILKTDREYVPLLKNKIN